MTEVNKVVIRYKDGRVAKGTTHDFVPGKEAFHFEPAGINGVREVKIQDLKAVFFVKDFTGRSDYSETKLFPVKPLASKGRKIAVLFKDGELITGYTLAYDPRRPGFFVMPTDEMSNNERVFVIASAIEEVGMGIKADNILRENLRA